MSQGNPVRTAEPPAPPLGCIVPPSPPEAPPFPTSGDTLAGKPSSCPAAPLSTWFAIKPPSNSWVPHAHITHTQSDVQGNRARLPFDGAAVFVISLYRRQRSA